MTRKAWQYPFMAAVLVLLSLVGLTSTASADGTVGVGPAPNYYTYILWTNWDRSISIWQLDVNLGFVSSQSYGPYEGWTARSLSVGPTSGNISLLWTNWDGTADVWQLDSSLNQVGSQTFGPYMNWTARRIS